MKYSLPPFVRPTLWVVGIIFVLLTASMGGLTQLTAVDAQDPQPVRRINALYLDDPRFDGHNAIAWFGRVDPTQNYIDVRTGYYDDLLLVHLHIFDRLMWYDQSPVRAELDQWDAATLYLNPAGNVGDVLPSTAYRFSGQLRDGQNRSLYQAVDQGDAGQWIAASTLFTTTTAWRANSLNGDVGRGWNITFRIPFASLGITSTPADGTVWGMALVVHDRDDAAGTTIAPQSWPPALDVTHPATWGQLAFGVPTYSPPVATPGAVITIRHGENGVSVPDAHVGGHSVCGGPVHPNYFTEWGNLNYSGYDQINIQNQWDIADWPCFSKYYITFPLDTLPADKAIISATLTLRQFGNAFPDEAEPSLIHILMVADAWDEATIAWNNAPLAVENLPGASVEPFFGFPGWPGIPRTWDVSLAVAQAYAADMPLRLVLYSDDAAYHSGKYFYSSDAGLDGRPSLRVLWGDAQPTPGATPTAPAATATPGPTPSSSATAAPLTPTSTATLIITPPTGLEQRIFLPAVTK
jgi:hypothetical protein